MRVSREYDRMPEAGTFRKLAKKNNWKFGWSYYITGRSVQGYRIVGMGSSRAEAFQDYLRQRR